MYNVIEIQKAFAGLVGFYQASDPQYPRIATALTNSSSGKFIQRAHSLCTIENLYNVAPEFKSFVYAGWVGSEPVELFDFRRESGKLFQYIGPGPSSETPSISTSWTADVDPFSYWIQKLYKNACSNLVSKLLEVKKIENAGKSILDSQTLYSGFGMLTNKIIKRDRFVGLKIYTSRNENVSINIGRLGFQVDAAQTVNFYLYHSSQDEPLAVIPVVIDKPGSFMWFDLPSTKLTYMNGNQNSNGVFYLGYYEKDLQGQAIKKEMNFSVAPCLTCSNYDVSAYNAWSKYTAITAVTVPDSALNADKKLFDQTKVVNVYDSNFGINLSISVYCDLTKFFISNKILFADALSKQVAVEVLNELAFSTRLNGIAVQTKQLAGAELNPDEKSGSFFSQYADGLKALDYDFSGFDANCLPCAKRSGISYETI